MTANGITISIYCELYLCMLYKDHHIAAVRTLCSTAAPQKDAGHKDGIARLYKNHLYIHDTIPQEDAKVDKELSL
jgi:hypothetical protein